jgi:DNA primase
MRSDGLVDEIKNRLDIVEHISDHVALKKAGANYRGLCPFHAEKTPSFMVHPGKQIFHCFGCGAGGDIFGFTMKHENLTFPEALRLLAKKAGVPLKREDPGARSERDAMKAALAEASRYYSAQLERSGPAKEYLSGRGLTAESLKAFAVGYAPEGWHNVFNHLKRKGFAEAIIMKSGLAASGARGPYDVFRGRVIFPISDIHGETIAFGGRVIAGGEPKYLNSPDTPLFKKGDTLYGLQRAKEAIRQRGFSVLAEGYLDVIMCHQSGIANAVAPLGTALTPGHARRLGRYAPELMLVFDGDAAGTAAARRSLPIVFAEGLKARLLMLPAGEDPDSLLRAKGPEHLEGLMKAALSPVDFLLRTAGGAVEEATNQAIALIAAAADPVVRGRLLTELSDRTRVNEREIREKLDRYRKSGSPAPAPKAGALTYNEEVLLLSAAVNLPDKAGALLERLPLGQMRDPLIRNIFQRLSGAGLDAMAAASTEEEKALVRRLSIEPGFDLESADRNIEDCLRKITGRQVDERIRSAEEAGDLKLLSRLLLERQKLFEEAR